MKPQHNDIAICAYFIWEKEGRCHGRDLEHWIQAETHLLASWITDNMQPVQVEQPSKNGTGPQKKQPKKTDKPFVVPLEKEQRAAVAIH